jgi:hypothetical protein
LDGLSSFAVLPRQPFEFKSQTVGDDQQTLMVAESVPNSPIVGPMFLPKEALDDLHHFASNPVASQALVVLGPPKCSKTAVLHHVLPSIVASRVGGLDPVFVRLTFSLKHSPQRAARHIFEALADVALAFGYGKVDLPEVITFENCSSKIPTLVNDLVRWFHDQKFELWFLFDECSVRV